MLSREYHLRSKMLCVISLCVVVLLSGPHLWSQEAVPSILISKLPPTKKRQSKEKSLFEAIQDAQAKKKGAIFKNSDVSANKAKTSTRKNIQKGKPENLGKFLSRFAKKTKPEGEVKQGGSKPTAVDLSGDSYTDLTRLAESRKIKSAFIELMPAIGPVDLKKLEEIAQKETASKADKKPPTKEAFLEVPPAI